MNPSPAVALSYKFYVTVFFAGSLEAANCWLVRVSSFIYSGCAETFQRFCGEKNQDFMIIRHPIN